MMQKESNCIKLLSLVRQIAPLNYERVSNILKIISEISSENLTEDEKNILRYLIDAFLFIVKNNKEQSSSWILPRYLPCCSNEFKHKITAFLHGSLELFYFRQFVEIVVDITKEANKCGKK
jgi:hypothetical protein